ncbi:hypothetical protein DFH09DRAFT_925141, partial [Mycena vulgaris]
KTEALDDIIDLTLSPVARKPIRSPPRPLPRRFLSFSEPKADPDVVIVDSSISAPPRVSFDPDQENQPPKAESSSSLSTVDTVRVGSFFHSFEQGQAAVYGREARLGHIWRVGQTKRASDDSVRRITLRCNHYGQPNATHRDDIDPTDHRAGRTIRTNCSVHVNLATVAGGGWHVTVIDWAHNHPPQVPVGAHIPRRPSQDQQDLVSEWASSGNFTRSHLSHILRARLPDHLLEPRQVAVWWQSPTQVELSRRFYDILINDNTYCRNQYGYPLNLGIVINNFGKTRNIWYAIHRTEDTESHNWVWKNHLRGAGRPPEVLGSDRHPSLIASVAETLPLTFHLFCLHHLGGNVATQLRPVLGSEWDNFYRDFWVVYRAYPAASKYLDEELYSCRSQWAWVWVSNVFTAGVRTNGRSEGENRINKAIGGPKKSFLQLFDGLNDRTEDQSTRDQMQSSRRRHEANLESLFVGPLKMICDHAGPFALQTCYKQMQDSLFYSTEESIGAWLNHRGLRYQSRLKAEIIESGSMG